MATRSEYYRLDVINRDLNQSPELRRLSGVQLAATCDDARRVRDAQHELAEGLVDWPSTSESEEDPEPSLPVIDKIWQGHDIASESIFFIAVAGYGCTSAAFGFRWINGGTPATDLLTAAHCFSKSGPATATLWVQNIPGAAPAKVGNYSAEIFRHPAFSGAEDWSDDIAVVTIKWFAPPVQLWRLDQTVGWVVSATDVYMRVFGFGTTSQYSYTGTQLHTGKNHGTSSEGFRPEWQYTVNGLGLYYVEDNDTDGMLCEGDSGGPQVLLSNNAIAAVSSGGEKAEGKHCSTTGGIQKMKNRSTIVATKSAWIQQVRGSCRHVGWVLECW